MQLKVSVRIVFLDKEREIDAGEKELIIDVKELNTCEKSDLVHRINKNTEQFFKNISYNTKTNRI
jgi:hypothetical protein